FAPTLSRSDIDPQRHGEFRGVLHTYADALTYRVQRILAHLEDEFVVHLQQHVGVVAAIVQPAVDRHHRALDDVGRGALHWRVDRGALGPGALGGVARMDVFEIQPPPEQRFDIAFAFRPRPRRIHVRLHAGITFEIALHVLRRFAARNAEPLRESVRAHAVHQAEIDHLGDAALL